MGNGIGTRIRAMRKANGFSQEDVGDAVRVTRSAVSLWEKGRSVPDDHHLERLAHLFGTTITHLRDGLGRPPKFRKLRNLNYRRDTIARAQRLIMAGVLDEIVFNRIDAIGREKRR